MPEQEKLVIAYWVKTLGCIALSLILVGCGTYFRVPLVSRFPLEIGALLLVTLNLLWRPLYINTGSFSDPPSQVMTFRDAMLKHPSAAAATGLGAFGFILMAAISMLVQLA